MKHNIYLVSRTDSIDWDEFDSMVVVAENEEEAIKGDPSEHFHGIGEGWGAVLGSRLKVVLLGEAADHLVPGVYCASFNAG